MSNMRKAHGRASVSARITMPPIVWPVRAFVLGAASRPIGDPR